MKTKNYKIDDLIEEAGEFLTKGTLDKEVLSAFMRIAFMRGECTQMEKDIQKLNEKSQNGWHGVGVGEIKTYPLSPEEEAKMEKVRA